MEQSSCLIFFYVIFKMSESAKNANHSFTHTREWWYFCGALDGAIAPTVCWFEIQLPSFTFFFRVCDGKFQTKAAMKKKPLLQKWKVPFQMFKSSNKNNISYDGVVMHLCNFYYSCNINYKLWYLHFIMLWKNIKWWFHLLRDKSHSSLPGSMWKTNCPHLLNHESTLIDHIFENLSSVSPRTANQEIT